MSEEPLRYTVTLDDPELARWAAASAKCATVERFLAASIAEAIACELDGGPVRVQVGDCALTVMCDLGSDA